MKKNPNLIDEMTNIFFVGREKEQALFSEQIRANSPRYQVFYINGPGGIGKSTLLHRFQLLARQAKLKVAGCNNEQGDIPSILGIFAAQLASQGVLLRKFEKQYKLYTRIIGEIEVDTSAPDGLSDLLSRAAKRPVLEAPEVDRGSSSAYHANNEEVEVDVPRLMAYLRKKLKNVQELVLIKNPVRVLTSTFVNEMNGNFRRRRALLCYDTFEDATRPLQNWFLNLYKFGLSRNAFLVIAGREPPTPIWSRLINIIKFLELDVFTKTEADMFFNLYGITNINRRETIIQLSLGLPIDMAWLTATAGMSIDHTAFANVDMDTVDLFLRQVNDEEYRSVALLSSIPRVFNLDILRQLLSDSNQTINPEHVFSWLIHEPYVRQRNSGWEYHPVVRLKMLDYLKGKSIESYRKLHGSAANYFEGLRSKLDISSELLWASETWRRNTVEYLYHHLVSEVDGYWIEIINYYLISLRKRWGFALELVELLNSQTVIREIDESMRQGGRQLDVGMQIIDIQGLKEGIDLFKYLCSIKTLDGTAKGIAFTYCGECLRLIGKWHESLSYLNEALQHSPKDTWTISIRGVVLRELGYFTAAIDDLSRSIALTPSSTWKITNRGITYRLMRQYQEAMADFNRVLELDPRNAEALAQRGVTNRELRQFEASVNDLTEAIQYRLDVPWFFINRGSAYRYLKQFELALLDFESALKLDRSNPEAIIEHGITCRLFGKPETAIADFDRVLEADPQNIVALGQRAITYREIGKLDEAINDFTTACQVDGKAVWILLERGITYRKISQYAEALSDFNLVLEYAPDNEEAVQLISLTQTYFK